MNSRIQDWMLTIEGLLGNLKGEWTKVEWTTKSIVLQETSALAIRLERIEEKLDQVLAELRHNRPS